MYGFSVLWKLFKSGLLATNAVAILHKQRFLRKCEHHDETNENIRSRTQKTARSFVFTASCDPVMQAVGCWPGCWVATEP